jgi:hypothetical protein
MKKCTCDSRTISLLGFFLMCGLPSACVRQDEGKSKGNEPNKPALNAGASAQGEATPKNDEPKKPRLYDPKADARAQIETATAKAKRQNARVLVMFGFEGWSWCHKLHSLCDKNAEIRKLLHDEYVTVLVDIEAPHADELLKECLLGTSPAERDKGVGYPYLAVLDGDGKVITAQRSVSLEEGSGHDPTRVKQFLDRWVAPRAGESDAGSKMNPRQS